jgi:predicted TIM-barrel fold metal-dependent hydrolase
MDLSRIAIVDNHAHPLTRRQPQTPEELRAAFSEAHSVAVPREHLPSAVHYRWSLRQLGSFLRVEPSEEAILRARAEEDFSAYSRRLMEDANLAFLLVDTGYPPPDESYSVLEMEEMLGVAVRPMLRLEVLEQRLIVEHASFGDVLHEFDRVVSGARDAGYVSLKSIAAYRTGLAVEDVDEAAAEAAFVPVRREAEAEGSVRLASKPLVDHFIWRATRHAARQGMPIQFHTGYGDPDLDLRLANPLHLRPLFEDSGLEGAPIVLLHESYPFTAEAAYLASAYANAYMDIAFTLPPLDRLELRRVLGVALGAAPASKLMVSSDGVGIPEHYWLGATRARQVLGDLLDEMVAASELDPDEAAEVGSMVLRDNARRVYRL